MAGLQNQSNEQMKEALRMVGLSYRSIARQVRHGKRDKISDTTVRSVLLNLPDQFCSAELKKKIWDVVRVAKQTALPKISQLQIPEN